MRTGDEVQSGLMGEPVLVEREKGTSIGKIGGVWMEGEGIEGSTLVLGASDGAQMACPNSFLHPLVGPLPLLPGDMVAFGVKDSRLRCVLDCSSNHRQAGPHRAPQAMEVPSTSFSWGGGGGGGGGGSAVQELCQILSVDGVQLSGPHGNSLHQLL